MTFLNILKDFTPTILPSGQIRCRCVFRDKHTTGSAGDGSNSLFLTPDKNVYHCFSCKSAGKITHLLQEKFDIPYYEAVELVNILPDEVKRKELEVEEMWEVIPPDEFLMRGFSAKYLRSKKVGRNKKGEIVIPLYDGHILKGIKYRLQFPKRYFWYSEGFIKDHYLYNYNLTRSLETGYTILAEGETSTWRIEEEFKLDVCSSLGVHLSEWQVEQLSKIPKIYLAYDAEDLAGIKGMYRAYDKLHLHTEVLFINYPAADPAECGKRQFLKAFREAKNYAEFKFLTSE